MIDVNGKEYELAIVGNIIGGHLWGENKEIKNGTKHFRAGAKVYCVFRFGGMGHEVVMILGKPRKSFRMIEIVLKRNHIKNFRIEKVYASRILAFLNKYPCQSNSEIIHKVGVAWLNETPTIEIEN